MDSNIWGRLNTHCTSVWVAIAWTFDVARFQRSQWLPTFVQTGTQWSECTSGGPALSKRSSSAEKQGVLMDTSNWGTQKNAPTVGRFWIFHLYVKTCFPVCSHLYLSPFFFLLVPFLLPPAFRLYFRFVLYNTYISYSHLISCHFLYCNCIIACSVEVCSMSSEEGP